MEWSDEEYIQPHTAMTIHYTIGCGKYHTGVRRTDIGDLLMHGHAILEQRGLTGEHLERGKHLYVRCVHQHFEQSGGSFPDEDHEREIVERIVKELGMNYAVAPRSTALTTNEFIFGTADNELRMEGLEPFVPASLPDPGEHLPPGIPEYENDPELSPLTCEINIALPPSIYELP